MQIRRAWAMPNKNTFLIPPISEIIKKYVGNGVNWFDPFAGENSPAEITNDLNPNKPTKYHLHAYEFIKQIDNGKDGCLFDPPYSLRQLKECYNGLGIDLMEQKGIVGPGDGAKPREVYLDENPIMDNNENNV